MVSARRTLSSAEESAGPTTTNIGTRPAGTNVSQATQSAKEIAQLDSSPVGTSAGEKRFVTGTRSVMDPVVTTSTPAMESVRTTPRAAATAILRGNFVFLMINPGSRTPTGSAEMTASTSSLSAMEHVRWGTVPVESIGVSAMKNRMTILPAMRNVSIRMSSLTIITGSVVRNASTGKMVMNSKILGININILGLNLMKNGNVTELVLTPVFLAMANVLLVILCK